MSAIAHADEILSLLDNAEDAIEALVEAQTTKSIRRAIDTRAAKLEAAIAPLFRRQGNAVVKAMVRLRKYLTEDASSDFDKLFDSAILDTSALMSETIDTAIRSAIVAGAQSTIRDFASDIVFSLTNPRAVSYAERNAAEAITNIDGTTREELRRLIEVAVANGTSYTELARQIRERYTSYSGFRSKLIAVTEIGNAYSEGNLIAARQIAADGIKIEKYWSNVGDRRVSPGCRTNTGAGWIKLEDDFPSGDQRPLRFPGCRCAALYRRAR